MEPYSFNITDGIAIAIVLGSALFALIRGLVREVLGIFSWALAVFVTLYVQEYTYPFWQETISSEIMARIVSYSSVFIITLVIGHVITYRVADAVDDGPLGSLDNTLGFVFGLLRGGVIISLFYMLVVNFTMDAKGKENLPQWLETAKSMPIMKEGAKIIVALLPADMQNATEKSLALEENKGSVKKVLRDKGQALKEQQDKNVPKNKERVKMLEDKDAKKADETNPDVDASYGNKERQSLDHLIESVQ